jgi:hypothetical protein
MGSSRCRGIGRHNTHPASSGRCALRWHNTLDPRERSIHYRRDSCRGNFHGRPAVWEANPVAQTKASEQLRMIFRCYHGFKFDRQKNICIIVFRAIYPPADRPRFHAIPWERDQDFFASFTGQPGFVKLFW